MNNGAKIRNTIIQDSSGCVHVAGGTFTMRGGEISGNTASYDGGGVYVARSGKFTKSAKGGVIYGSDAALDLQNKARESNAVYISARAPKVRNTTAGASDGIK
jgi:hypothetical protein